MFTRDKNVFIKHAFENTNLIEISGEKKIFNVLIQTLLMCKNIRFSCVKTSDSHALTRSIGAKYRLKQF
jgi:hypothetical protein